VLGIHSAGDAGDALADQRLSFRGLARGDHRAGALVADRHRLADPRGPGAPPALGHRRDEPAGRIIRVLKLRRAEQQAEVGRVDRRSLDPHQHLVALWIRHLLLGDLDGQSPVPAERRGDVAAGGH
jgi:hypothetical protein